jgi:hypothetical protein
MKHTPIDISSLSKASCSLPNSLSPRLEDSASAATAVLEKVPKRRKSVIFSKAKEDFFVDFERKRGVLHHPRG